ncbi:MAG TPA: SUMF1/EgtB/PvdO family nonheme iron enzyme [Bacteroidia bacterium]
MEAKLVFGSEALHVPPLQKEKELLQKITGSKGKNLFRWMVACSALIIISAIMVYYIIKPDIVETQSAQPIPPENDKSMLSIQTHTIEATDSVSSEPASVSLIVMSVDEKRINDPDTVQEPGEEKWTTGDPGIKSDYKPSPKKYDPKFVDAYENIPVLSPKQKAANNKLKDKMIRQLIKKDKSAWSLVRMGTENIGNQKISYNPFYIATMEVTNNQYRVFLQDLIIKDRTDDYIKAVPDTARWLIGGKEFYEPMRKNYYWHPAYNDYPVLNVSREGAKMYCDWLTSEVNEKIKKENPEKAEGLYINDIRIPNEIEWVAAARAGNGDVPYPWSTSPERNSVQNSRGCFLCNFSIINYPDSLKKLNQCANQKLDKAITSAGWANGDFFFTAKVNSYNPNDHFLFCMSGNAAEMVWEHETMKPITKGGSWNSDAEHVQINAKENAGVTEGSPYIGFRPVFTAPPLKK